MKHLLFILLLNLTSASLLKAQICQVTITRVVNGNQVQYFGSSPDNPSTWSWFFNGVTPSTSNLQNPVVTYNTPGTFIAALTVSGGPNNCSPALSRDVDTIVIATTSLQEAAGNGVFVLKQSGFGGDFILDSDSRRMVTIRLYEISGKEVGTVFNGEVEPGINRFSLPDKLLESTIYFLYARSGTDRSICRLARIKP